MSSANGVVEVTEKATAAVIDVSNSSMFTIFSDKQWLARFDASPFKFFLLPLVAIGFAVNAIISGIHFSKATNKNITRFFYMMSMILGAIGASVSIYGGIIAELAFKTVFPIGPYFFLGAVSIGLTFNLSQLIANAVALSRAPKDSIERQQYKRAIIFHSFLSVLLSTIVGSVVFVLLSTSWPFMGSVMSLAAAGLCAANFVYTFLPQSVKGWFDTKLGLEIPKEDMLVTKIDKAYKDTPVPHRQKELQVVEKAKLTLFQRAYRKEVIQTYLQTDKFDEAKTYLLSQLTQKISAMEKILQDYPNSQKHRDKHDLLSEVKDAITKGNNINGKEDALYQSYALSRQSFFSFDKGDVEDLMEAILLYFREKQNASPALTGSLNYQ